MIFSVLISCSFIMLASSASIPNLYEKDAQIISYESSNDGSGNYQFKYETSNNMKRAEKGTLVNVGLPTEHLVVEGYYSYIQSDGEPIYVRYVADQNGIRFPNQSYKQAKSLDTALEAEEEQKIISPAVTEQVLAALL